MENTETRKDRVWMEINIDHLRHNVNTLKSAMPPDCELMAVVKAEAYGHGAYEIAASLNKMSVRAFAVATIDEGIELRKQGICGEILILGYTSVCRAPELAEYDLIQTLIDADYAKDLNNQKIAVKAHIKIDTGMHRLGIPVAEYSAVKNVFFLEHIKVCGMFTHLCCADSRLCEDIAFTRGQISSFYGLVNCLKKDGIPIPKLHIQSSYGLLNYPELSCDYVRAGIALYGVLSSPHDDTVLKPDLRPVLSLKSRIVLIRSVKKGDSVGYGRSFQARRDSRIAIVPAGYGDGIPRNLSPKVGSVLIRKHTAPMIGRVCMDQLAVDITDVKEAKTGDIVTLIDAERGSGLSAPAVAEKAGSISNELLSRMGRRVSAGKVI